MYVLHQHTYVRLLHHVHDHNNSSNNSSNLGKNETTTTVGKGRATFSRAPQNGSISCTQVPISQHASAGWLTPKLIDPPHTSSGLVSRPDKQDDSCRFCCGRRRGALDCVVVVVVVVVVVGLTVPASVTVPPRSESAGQLLLIAAVSSTNQQEKQLKRKSATHYIER